MPACAADSLASWSETEARFLVEVEVPLYLLAFFPQQHGEQVARPEFPAEPRHQLRVQRGPRVIDRMAVLGEELAPHLHVALLDPGQLDVDVFPVGIRLLSSECQIEECGVSFVLPMVEPFLHVSSRHAPRYSAAPQVTSR
ncbi:MAG: hypothetical protein DMD64_10470 [Gemmatimonadetes bacterium]|nr:MAG: hypothetical protein DMD64_10470 [Gemmatimonadota bacterium]